MPVCKKRRQLNGRAKLQSGFLSREEEQELARKMHAGDIEARNKLVMSHIPLVRTMAGRYARHGVAHEDLFQEGINVMLEKAQGFDLARGTRFSTFITHWIRAAMQEQIRRQPVICGPDDTFKLYSRFKRVSEKVSAELGRPGNPDEVAKAMGVEVSVVKKIEAVIAASSPAPIDSKFPATDITLADVLPDQATFSPEDALMVKDELGEVRKRMEALLRDLENNKRISPRDKAVLMQSIGVGFREGPLLREIGDVHGVSRERIRQILVQVWRTLHGAPQDVRKDRNPYVLDRERESALEELVSCV